MNFKIFALQVPVRFRLDPLLGTSCGIPGVQHSGWHVEHGPRFQDGFDINIAMFLGTFMV